MDWGSGYRASYRLYRVDQSTWAETEEVMGLQSASVESDMTKDLVQSGSVTVELPVGGSFERGYYRLVMVTEQGGGLERFDIATLYLSSATRNVSDGSVTMPLVGRSVIYPASRRRVLVGSYAPLGVDGAAYAADLLSTAIQAPVEVQGGFRLDEHMVFEVGTTVLDAVMSVLRAGGFHLSVDGSGRVIVRGVPSEASIGPEAVAKLVIPGVSDTLDTSEVPNRYTAIDRGQSVTITNDDPESNTSTISRGYFDDVVDSSPKRVDGETLTHYARRMLYEMSVVRRPYSYQREYSDSIVVGDLMPVTLNGEAVTLRSVRQSLSCTDGGIVVSEVGETEVPMWQG